MWLFINCLVFFAINWTFFFRHGLMPKLLLCDCWWRTFTKSFNKCWQNIQMNFSFFHTVTWLIQYHLCFWLLLNPCMIPTRVPYSSLTWKIPQIIKSMYLYEIHEIEQSYCLTHPKFLRRHFCSCMYEWNSMLIWSFN